MKRRAFIATAATVPVAATCARNTPPVTAYGQAAANEGCNDAIARFRASLPAHLNEAYVEHAVVPFFLSTIQQGERPLLPMINVTLSKENALPFDLWGLIYDDWKPTPAEGVTVFLQGLEKRGENNLRKRIYFSALTPDLYQPMYQEKVTAFFDRLFEPQYAGKPFMRHYLDYYFDLYWDLHVGVKGDAIPAEVRQIGESFNTVLAYRNPKEEIVYENYMKVRAQRATLKRWIAQKVNDVARGRVPHPEKTLVYYWLKNAGNGEHFARQDVVFEAFHNFVALSQWGNTIFGIMSRLRDQGGDPAVQAAFASAMAGDYDRASGDSPFTPLDLFTMELFRTISPNGGSISAAEDARRSAYGDSPYARLRAQYERHNYTNTPHTATSLDPRLWNNPEQFDPERYKHVPTSDQIDAEKTRSLGLPRCPFETTTMKVADGRNVGISNSGFGTVFGVADGKAMPVCDYAGFAPFGFGYRRCPGEQFTIDVFEDFLRKVWKEKIAFRTLRIENAAQVPIGPNAVITDDIGFFR